MPSIGSATSDAKIIAPPGYYGSTFLKRENLLNILNQIAFIANHAEDKVVIVDESVVPLLAKSAPEFQTVEHYIVVGDGDASPLEALGVPVSRYYDLLAADSPAGTFAVALPGISVPHHQLATITLAGATRAVYELQPH